MTATPAMDRPDNDYEKVAATHVSLRRVLELFRPYGAKIAIVASLMLLGAGADLDLAPTLRASLNANYLRFADTASLEVARAQAGIDREIGLDFSVALTWRPLASQNVVVRLSAAALIPGEGFKDLYGSETPYSILGNVVFTY